MIWIQRRMRQAGCRTPDQMQEQLADVELTDDLVGCRYPENREVPQAGYCRQMKRYRDRGAGAGSRWLRITKGIACTGSLPCTTEDLRFGYMDADFIRENDEILRYPAGQRRS